MRDTLIIAIACLAAILLGAWLFYWGAGTGIEKQAPAAAFSVLDQGVNSGQVEERTNFRIRSADELEKLWVMIYGAGGAPRTIDWGSSEVLAVFDGSHTTGGYQIAVSSISTDGGTRTVHITHTAPGSSCATTEAITSPYEIIVLPKSALPLAHVDEAVTADCK